MLASNDVEQRSMEGLTVTRVESMTDLEDIVAESR